MPPPITKTNEEFAKEPGAHPSAKDFRNMKRRPFSRTLDSPGSERRKFFSPLNILLRHFAEWSYLKEGYCRRKAEMRDNYAEPWPDC